MILCLENNTVNSSTNNFATQNGFMKEMQLYTDFPEDFLKNNAIIFKSRHEGTNARNLRKSGRVGNVQNSCKE